MRATKELGKLADVVQDRVRRLRSRFHQVRTLSPHERSPGLSYCVVELDNLVVSALRQYGVSSMSGCRTRSGARVTGMVTFSDEKAIAAYVLWVLNPKRFQSLGSPQFINRREEPTIRDPKDLDKVFQHSALSNQAALQSGLALNTTLFRDLATFRNFYAHRNDDTWRKAKQAALNLGIAQISQLDQAVIAMAQGGPATLFDEWLFDTELFFDQVTQ